MTGAPYLLVPFNWCWLLGYSGCTKLMLSSYLGVQWLISLADVVGVVLRLIAVQAMLLISYIAMLLFRFYRTQPFSDWVDWLIQEVLFRGPNTQQSKVAVCGSSGWQS